MWLAIAALKRDLDTSCVLLPAKWAWYFVHVHVGESVWSLKRLRVGHNVVISHFYFLFFYFLGVRT